MVNSSIPEKADDITEKALQISDKTSSPSPQRPLKLDRHGLPLVPQPSDDPNDPLNFPYVLKVYIALLISLLSFTAQLSSAIVNPTFNIIAEDLNVSVTRASYLTTVWILFGGVAPLLFVPLANVYGRRPLYVLGTLIACLSNIGAATASSYGGLMTGRVFNGIASSIALGFGAAVICDLFTQGERGLWIGIYTVSTTNGPHVSPIAGGYIAQRLDWRWTIWIPAIVQGVLGVLLLLTLPETLFSREEGSRLEGERSWVRRWFWPGRVLERRIRARDFWTSFRMARYAAVLLPCVYYMTNNTYGSTAFAVTGSHITKVVFDFDLGQTGLFMGVPLTVGCLIGELLSGWFSDVLINAYAKRHGGYRKPEVRLWLLPWTVLLAIGTATYGFCIEHKKPWIDAAVSMAVSGLGTQVRCMQSFKRNALMTLKVGTTVVYTYCTDSYKPQSGEIGAIINLFKSGKLRVLVHSRGPEVFRSNKTTLAALLMPGLPSLRVHHRLLRFTVQ